MRAIAFSEFGDLDRVVRVREVPDVYPGPGDIRVRVVAAAVSPSDAGLPSGQTAKLWRTMGLFPPARNFVAGYDAAGVVDDVGPDVGGFAAGDEVAILTTALQPQPTFGSHAEYVVVPQESAVLLPRGSDLIAWSTLLMNSLTARMALELLNLDTDSVVAVTGAAGAVGAYAVQLAKRRGHTVVADAADKDRDLVAVLGADHVVARSDNFARLVREVATDGVAGVVDAALVGAALHPAVRDGGTVACLRPTDGPTQRGIRWEWPFVPDELTNTRALEELRDFAASGALALRVSKTYTPEQAPQAYRAVLRGGLRGRPVIVFDPGYPNFHVQAGE